MGEQHPDANFLRGNNRLGQALLGPGLPNHTLQGIDGGGVFADEWNLASQSQYILPLFVFDERMIELSGLPGYERQGPEARTPAYGFWKTGGFRVRFIVECIADLRQRLIQRGSDMLIRFGKTEQVLDELVSSLQAQGDSIEGVWMQKEAASEDIELEHHIAKTMHSRRVPLSFSYGKTLIHPADLPFDIKDCPDVFTPFRKKVESLGKRMVRATAQPPDQFKPFPSHINDARNYQLNVDPYSDISGVLNAGRSTGPKMAGPPSYDVATGQVEETKIESISWDDLMKLLLHAILQPQCVEALNNYAALTSRHPASAFPFRGGETSALERLEWYFMRGRMASGPAARGGLPPVARYKQTRNNLLGSGYSTKMSPFLAYGCVSARQIWETLNDLEERLGEDQSTYWVRFELQWRDYFFIQAARFGDLLYALGGFETVTDPRQAEKKADWWKPWDPLQDPAKNLVTRLLEGRTGIPFIDAQIIELRESGFMSNRGRQNVASFLSKDLQCDWRVGAEFFASHLIDYDATSNFGNWQYVAGVGNDPRASRQFNTIKQAKDFDSFGEYVKTWIPTLRNLPVDFVHTPWLLSGEERWQYGLKSSHAESTLTSYPARPMIEFDSWNKHYDRRDGSGSKMRGNPQEKVKDVTERFRRLKAAYRTHSINLNHNHSHSHNHNHEHHHHHHHHLLDGGNAASPRWKPTVGLWRRNQAAFSGMDSRAQEEDSAPSGSGGDFRNDASSTLSTGSSAAIPSSAKPMRRSIAVPALGRHRQVRHCIDVPAASLSNSSSGNGSSSPPYATPVGTPTSNQLPAGARPIDQPRRPLAHQAPAPPSSTEYYSSHPSSDAYDVMGSDDAGQYGSRDVSTDAPRNTFSSRAPPLSRQPDAPSRWSFFSNGGGNGHRSSGSDSYAGPPLRTAVPPAPVGTGRTALNPLERKVRSDHPASASPAAQAAPGAGRCGLNGNVNTLGAALTSPAPHSTPTRPAHRDWPSNAHASLAGPGKWDITASASASGPGATSRASVSRNGTASSSSASSPLPRKGPSYFPPQSGASSPLPPNPYRAHNYHNFSPASHLPRAPMWFQNSPAFQDPWDSK